MTSPITADEVHRSLGRHLLTDGYPLVMDLEKSSGSRIYDLRTGRWFLDFFSFYATRPVALNHPKLRDPEYLSTLTRAASVNPTNSDVYTREMAAFVETFERVAMPKELPLMFMISGGAVAVENALKAAFDWKVRRNFRRGEQTERGQQVLHLKEAFHGRAGYCLSLTNTADAGKYEYYPKFPWPRILNPKLRFPVTEAVLEEVALAEAESLRQAKEAFLRHRDDIACVILEPIQGEGGDNHFRPEYLRALRDLAHENEALFIFDEVQSGLGLTGRMWAHQHLEVTPDLMVFGKKTQVCGVLAGKILDEEPRNVFRLTNRIDSTWGGNLADMVRCGRYLEIIEAEHLVDNAARKGLDLQASLRQLQDKWPALVSNARGVGLMCAFDLNDPKARDALVQAAYDEGLLLLKGGFRSVRIRPALDVTDRDLAEFQFLLDRAVARLAAGDIVEPVTERRRAHRTGPSS